MLRGTVKWFDKDKGYGFIKKEDGEEVFVHRSEIKKKDNRSLEEGQEVFFILVESDHGIQAQDVVQNE